MVTKSKVKSKSTKKSIKTKPKSSSNKSTTKGKTPTKKNPIVETKMSLLSKAGIGALGTIATLGTGYIK